MAEKTLPKWLNDPVLARHRYSDYWVEYSVFKGDMSPGIVSPELQKEYLEKHEKQGCVCFSGLPTLAKRTKEANRLIYHLEIDKAQVKQHSPQNRIDWVRLLKAHNMLPAYVPEDAIREIADKVAGESYQSRTVSAEGYYLFDITDALQSVVYMHLTTLRDLRENYGIPKVAIFLAKKGMDFYAAFGFGHRYGSCGAGHAVISISSYDEIGSRKPTRYKSNKITKSLISLNLVNGLVRFLKEPKAFDKHKLADGTHWNCYPIIDTINQAQNNVQIDIVDAFNPHAVRAIHAKNDKEFDEHVEAFMADVSRGCNADYVPGDEIKRSIESDPVANIGTVAPVKTQKPIVTPAPKRIKSKAFVLRRMHEQRRRNEAQKFQWYQT